MFTSDGAAVMLGCNNGVAVRLRRDNDIPHLLDQHCVCHAEALAVKDAYESFPKIVETEMHLKDLLHFLHGHNKMQGLNAVSEVLEVPVYKSKRIYEIRLV